MTNNKVKFGIVTMLVLMAAALLSVPSKVAIAQEEMMPMENKTMMTPEILQQKITEMKTKHPMLADMLDKIQTMTLEETVKNIIGVMGLQHLLMTHAKNLVEGKAMGNQTTVTQ
jgi:hypothetical protein